MKTSSLLLCLWVGLVLGASTLPAAEDARLEAFFRDYLEQVFQQQPTTATALGDHRFDAQLDDISPVARAGWKKLTQQTLRELPRRIAYRQLSRPAQIDFEILQQELRRNLWLDENFHPFETDPRTYGNYITDSVYRLLTQATLPTETNVANCIARMRAIPRVIAIAQQTLTHPPEAILETAIRQNRGAIAFYETELFQLAGATPQRAQLEAAAAPIVSALRDYQHFLETGLRPRATGNWRIGKKKFTRKLELMLDSGMTAQQVVADAEAEFTRVHRDLYLVARQLWSRYFPQQPLPPDDATGRRTTIAQVIAAVSEEHGQPDQLLSDVQATVSHIKTFIRDRHLLALPEPDACQVIEMPEFNRGNSVAYLENAPPLDPRAASFYAVSPPPADWEASRVRTYLEEYNAHLLQILTIHEAYPGHYVQLEYANRNPSLIRKVLASGVYIEGWAVYTEQMLLDQGYGDGDLRLRLMQLKFYLRTVVNAILDYRMHCARMTDAEAMRLMVEGAFQSEGEARLKIIRAKQSSTQLSTYFVGRMAHYRLRQALQRELGDQFDLARYHEAVLNVGSVPVKYLPELVRTQLNAGK